MKIQPDFMQYFKGKGASGLPRAAVARSIMQIEAKSQGTAYRRTDKALGNGILSEDPATKLISLAKSGTSGG